MKRLNVYSKNLNGHRQSYVDVFKKLFNANNITLNKGSKSREPLLFLMVEDDFLAYFLISIIRSLFGFKTIGLVFCAKRYTSRGNFVDSIKYCMLYFLNLLPCCFNLSIIPSYTEPRIKKICRSWIYDPQFWDLGLSNKTIDSSTNKKTELECFISSFIEDDFIKIVSIGEQSVKKGTLKFIHLSNRQNNPENIKYFFGGKFDNTVLTFLESNPINALGVNRFVSDEEIEYLYFISDLVWCCYHESYDQASGIFGRAIQFGIPVVVREGSCLHKICQNESYPFILPEDITNIRVKPVKMKLETVLSLSESRMNDTIQKINSILKD